MKYQSLIKWTVAIFLGAFIIWGTVTKTFLDAEKLQHFVASAGWFGPLLLLVFSALQVIIPVLPGGIGLLPGTLLYGPFWGFIINYIGVVIGSIVVFLLARNYGESIINKFFPKGMGDKYRHWISNQKRFDWLFMIAIFLPIAPDDFLCYLAGTTKMSLKKFVVIIILGKPLALFTYTFGLNKFYHWIFKDIFL